MTNVFPEAKSAVRWVRHGWRVAPAYVVGFAVLLATLGWNPNLPAAEPAAPAAVHE